MDHNLVEIEVLRTDQVVPFTLHHCGRNPEDCGFAACQPIVPGFPFSHYTAHPEIQKMKMVENADVVRNNCLDDDVPDWIIFAGHMDQVLQHGESDTLGHVHDRSARRIPPPAYLAGSLPIQARKCAGKPDTRLRALGKDVVFNPREDFFNPLNALVGIQEIGGSAVL
jgi:hypothetical protein